MLWEELEFARLQLISQMVQLDSLVVVNVQMLLLGNCKHRVVMEKAEVSDDLLGLEFARQLLPLPVKHGDMASLRSDQQLAPISAEI